MGKEERTAAWAGIFLLLTGLLLVAAIAVFGQRSRLFKEHYELRAEFGNVQGLAVGATVRMAGVLVGSVRAIEVAPEPDAKKVTVSMDIETVFRAKIRADSVASIRTLGMLGDKYVELAIGSAKERQLDDGDTLPSQEPMDIYELADAGRQIVARLNRLSSSLEAILHEFEKGTTLANLNAATSSLANIAKGIEQGPGPLHSVIFDPKLDNLLKELEASSVALRTLLEKAGGGEGALGKMLLGDEYIVVARRLREAVDRTDKLVESATRIADQIEKGDSVAHSLLYDPEEKATLAELRESLARLNDMLQKTQSTDGTLGLLINDPGVWEDFRRVLGGVQRSRILRSFILRSLQEDADAGG